MITAAYCRTMARYNAWQNENLYGAADTLDEAARRADRGAFFGSIHGTLSHLLWGDRIWMSRFDGWAAPAGGIAGSRDFGGDWDAMMARRREADTAISDWARRLDDAGLEGDLSWYSGALQRDVQKPTALLVMHFFNHQTHHRGQVHAMLTAAGARPDDTDLFIMD